MSYASATATTDNLSLDSSSVKMLLVEDSMVFRRMLGHYAKKDKCLFIEAESFRELKDMGNTIAEVQVAWVDLNLEQETSEAAVAYLRKKNPHASIILMSAASEIEVSSASQAINADFFAVKPIPYDLFHVFTNNAYQLWQRKYSSRVINDLQQQVGKLCMAFYDAEIAARQDYAERVLSVTATALNLSLGLSSVAAFEWDGHMTGMCRMAWGNSRTIAGATITDRSGLFKKAILQGSLRLQANDLQAVRNSYLKKILQHSHCILPSAAANAKGSLIWILTRQDGAPFSDAQVDVANQMIQQSSLACHSFDCYMRLEAAINPKQQPAKAVGQDLAIQNNQPFDKAAHNLQLV